MRILQISSNDCSGGYWEDLLLGLIGEKHEVLVLALGRYEKPSWLGKEVSLDFIHLYDWRSLRNVKNSISAFKPEIIQGHLYHGNILSTIMSLFLRVPFISTRHYSDANWNARYGLHRLVDRFILKSCDVVLTHSRATRNWLIEKEGIQFDKVKVIHQGFNSYRILEQVGERMEIRSRLGVKDNDLLVVTLGRFTVAKGYGILMEAISQLVPDFPNLQFRFFGLGNPDWIVSRIDSLSISENCKVVGLTDEPYSIINASDLVVHPSLSESFNQVIVEASILAKPIVATRVAASPEQLVHNHSGVLVLPASVSELAFAISKITKDEQLRDFLGANAKSKALSEFSLSQMIKELSALLVDIGRPTNPQSSI